MNVSKEVADSIQLAYTFTIKNNYEYVSPEAILYAISQNYYFRSAFQSCGGNVELLQGDLIDYMDSYLKLTQVPESEPDLSASANQALVNAQLQAANSGKDTVEFSHLLHGIWTLPECYAVYYMESQGVEESMLLQAILNLTDRKTEGLSEADHTEEAGGKPDFERYAPYVNDLLDTVNPLIGREAELERTIQILLRKDKNNPLHIGEPGVGKTALVYGLARKINEKKVPDLLKDAKIYALDLGSLLAGTQYRGDLEKRLKNLLEDISKEANPIIYIDEIHNLSGAGAVGESSFDISNLLKPYLASSKIRFIGATTYEEYKKYFEKNKSLVRRFQNVEIGEPSEEETLKILEGLKKKYEKYHGVTYRKDVLSYIVKMSRKYIKERFLPDKAIDLMDEAGSYRKMHPLDQKTQSIGKDVINEILTKICRVPIESISKEENDNLATLERRILSRVFGQEEAVSQVVNAIKFSRAGLLEDGKPLASFLFAGPTGVGKTEIARTLAEELGVSLVRFDMSEYGEKHAIAKLIGSPAGYVGYEEGGLLTEAIRKNPSCVLLLDEIEKAHPEIFNVLLQVMDYATLTDNQGRKADFRNVIIIMTSNAGASQIGKSGIGFSATEVNSSVISEEVKRIFQPEFRNRLSRIVVFNHMDDRMGRSIAGRKLDELAGLLLGRKVNLAYTDQSLLLLAKKGSSREFGAREMDRIIAAEIKPLLVDDLLYGKLKKGGNCCLDSKGDSFILICLSDKKKKQASVNP